MTKLSEPQFRGLLEYRDCADVFECEGTCLNGHTDAALMKRGLIEHIPGRLINRITDLGRAALKAQP